MKVMPFAVVAGVAGVATGALLVWRRAFTPSLSDDVARFHADPLLTLVCAGHVTQSRARIWVRAEVAGPLLITVTSGPHSEVRQVDVSPSEDADHTVAFDLADHGFTLSEDTAYTVEVAAEQRTIGTCSLRTAASSEASPGRITLGIASCNNPFNDRGETSEQATELLDKLADAWDERGVHHAFYLGDQVYTDLPYRLSLFDPDYFPRVAPPGRETVLDCTASEVRRLIHQRYRLFWKGRGWQELQSRFASHTMLDDHEVVDNFGTAPEHSTERWDAFRQGALAAYDDYQATRGATHNDPACFDQTWTHGVVATYLLDIRSQRQADDERMQMYSKEQLGALRQFLSDNGDKHVILLGLSVPFMHVPDWVATVGAQILGDDSDAADRWSYFKARQSRDDLLQLIHDHMRSYPKQRVVVISGDIHVGCINQIGWDSDVRPLYQIASSAITNKQSVLYEQMTELAPKLSNVMGAEDDLYACASLLDAENGDHNPYGGLNAGIVEVDVGEDESRVRLSLLGLVDDAVVPVFESAWL